MLEPTLDLARLDSVIFDLDGTLYRQAPVRRAMALRLLRAHLFRPIQGMRTMRAISAYRHAQEDLRLVAHGGDLVDAQLTRAAEDAGMDRDAVAQIAAYWIQEAPLAILPRYARPGLGEMLTSLRLSGHRLAVLSDYPAETKLRALGVLDLFDLVLCAQDPEIGVFKPDPLGLQVALQRLGIHAAEALYVGDRADVDAVAAAAAGVPCAILSAPGKLTTGTAFVQITSFADLQSRLVPV